MLETAAGTLALVREPLDNLSRTVFADHQTLREHLEVSYGELRLVLAMAGKGESWVDPIQTDESGVMIAVDDEAISALVGSTPQNRSVAPAASLGERIIRSWRLFQYQSQSPHRFR